MSWLLLIVVGLIVLAVGYWAPFPAPIPVIVRVIGGVLLILGILLLVFGLFSTSTVDNDLDHNVGAAQTVLLN